MTVTKQLDRLLQTLRYHRTSQFARRLYRLAETRWNRVSPLAYRPSWNECWLDDHRIEALNALSDWRLKLWSDLRHSGCAQDLSKGSSAANHEVGVALTANQRGLSVQIEESSDDGGRLPDSPVVNWRPPAPRLELFHLQYQEWLLELADNGHAELAWATVQSWLQDPMHDGPHHDANAWHPFCISRRLPVWLMLAARHSPPNGCRENFWHSVANQTEWLQTHLEHELGGNHLLENLRALTVAGYCLQGDVSIDLPALRMQVCAQLEEQTLPSGEHYERTPTYHAIMLHAVNEILHLMRTDDTAARDAARVASIATWMSDFLRSITHPDGQVPLFGDSVFLETPAPVMLCDWADQLAGEVLLETHDRAFSPSVSKTKHSDYWSWKSDAGTDFLIFDRGPLACDHLPAHGHADLMTIEASIDERRWFVDAGTFDYEDSDMRSYCRGTAAHNTLQVDKLDHADVWSRFRMGRRGHPTRMDEGRSGDFGWGCGIHNAYASIGITATGRVIAAKPGPVWIVVDWIEGSGDHLLESRLRLHPELSHSPSPSGSVLKLHHSSNPTAEYELALLGDSELDLQDAWYCPDFGRNDVTTMLRGTRRVAGSAWLGWLLRPKGSKVDVAVELDEGALKIRIDSTYEICIQLGKDLTGEA